MAEDKKKEAANPYSSGEQKKGQAVKTTSINMDKGVKTIWHLQRMKDKGEKITMIGVAALDPIFSMYAEVGGADLIRYTVPGDSVETRAANAAMWTRMQRKVAPKTCLNCFLQTQTYADKATALKNASIVVGDGADSVIMMGVTNETLKYTADNYIPHFGHVGVLSGWQTGQFGGYRRQGKTAESAMAVAKMAYEYQENGMKGMTIEMTAREVTAAIAKKLRVPVVQVAGSAPADGSEMVVYDLWSMIPGAAQTRHAKSYGGGSVADICIKGVAEFKAEIQAELYPAEENGWGMDDPAEVEKFLAELDKL